MIPDATAARPAAAGRPLSGARLWSAVLIPVVLLAGVIALILAFDPADRFRDPAAPPVENVSIRRVVLEPGLMHVTLLNEGPDAVTIAQVAVDDAYWQFTADRGTRLAALASTTLSIPYPWVAGEAHLVTVLSSTGTRFDHEIPVALATPKSDARHLGIFAAMGVFVGVIPVASYAFVSDQHPGQVHHSEARQQAQCHRRMHESLPQARLAAHLSEDLHHHLEDGSDPETEKHHRGDR